MTVRAGIVVTGTEVLTGRITDRNGPWVAERLFALGVDVAHITVCGDRPEDLAAELRFLADEGVSLIVTTGGLGPTADDLTVATVAEFTGRALHLDEPLRDHIAEIIRRWQGRGGSESASAATAAGIDKQAMVPEGAQPIPPTGTAPGVAVPAGQDPRARRRLPAILVLPGPPPELQMMWPAAINAPAIDEAIADHPDMRQDTIRMFGLPEADLAAGLRAAQDEIVGFDELEITTCLRRGELEIVTRYPVSATDDYTALSDFLTGLYPTETFSTDGTTIDDQLADLLTGRRIATAESCTGGMVAARLTDRAGSSAYVQGGVVSYSNDVKINSLGVPASMIDELGAVSEPVAAAMADGVMARLGADTAISTTGIAGPGGETPGKPVGTVCFGIGIAGSPTLTRTLHLPGDRAAVRERSTTIAFHLLADALRAASS
ncbi:competence/damage-inducible protein A [Gordonia otitidis]|uniref:CinA-like protein n=1 Tax=Gordonia otitidis (strain DSM 44809 / CCUG 52243 / JCM 12355 / NBRC 100426 / IFM 10032) TaxID=1108044 RepID=H5TTF5_GORO1|nr:competence/damage-inducible protein A [Gordonia otitidis]GAB36763.1 CinA-like protein [Gordonia otitidis NBRC 100426]